MKRRPILPFRGKRRKRGVEGALNLGPKSSAWLEEIGITTLDQVRQLGPIEVCRRLRSAGHPVSVLLAYALEGALAGEHWNEIPPEAKHHLRAAFARMKGK